MLSQFSGLRSVGQDMTGFDQLQRQLQSVLRELYLTPIINGNLIEFTFPSSANTDAKVNHGLGRAAIGYFPVSLSAAATIYLSSTVNQNDQNEIILKCNASSTVTKLWIF